MKRAYLDSSAYLSIILGEKGSSKINKLLAGHILLSSTLLFVEAERNILRLMKDNKISFNDFRKLINRMNNDKSEFILRDLTLDLCLNGVYPAIKLPKSADLVHLRTALWFRKEFQLEMFITLDIEQRMAAQELLLPAIEI